MKTMMLLFTVPWLAAFSTVSPQGVYGKDHRLDIYQLPESGARSLADSTVAMISKNALEPRGNSYVIDSHASSDLNLCPGEQFIGQPTLADCSGTLIGEDLVLTAGHCISNKDCKDNFFVFGYQMNSADSRISEFPQEEVYSCYKVHVCLPGKCDGEEATNVSAILEVLP